MDDGHQFALANGAAVHNSNGADAFRQFAQGYTNIDDRIVQPKSWRDRLTVNYQSKGSAQAA